MKGNVLQMCIAQQTTAEQNRHSTVAASKDDYIQILLCMCAMWYCRRQNRQACSRLTALASQPPLVAGVVCGYCMLADQK